MSRGAKTESGTLAHQSGLFGDEEDRDGSRTCSRNASRRRHDGRRWGRTPSRAGASGLRRAERDPRQHGDGRGGDALEDLEAHDVEPTSVGAAVGGKRAAYRVGSGALQPRCDEWRQTKGTLIGKQVETSDLMGSSRPPRWRHLACEAVVTVPRRHHPKPGGLPPAGSSAHFGAREPGLTRDGV